MRATLARRIAECTPFFDVRRLDVRCGLANSAHLTTLPAMITVATCSNPAEAMLLKSLLEANDIEAFVPDELTAQSAPHYSGSGIHLQVADEDAETAKRILDEAENTFAEEDLAENDDDEDQSR
jgi:hypothetical protein